MDVWYVDTSAVAKLIGRERETAALRRWLRHRTWVVGDLHRTELRRAARRVGPGAVERAERLLAELDVVSVTGDVFDTAGRLAPAELRSLDAIHLATAQALGPDLSGVVAYDERLLAAAAAVGITVASPS